MMPNQEKYEQAAEGYIERLSALPGDWQCGKRGQASNRFASIGFPHKKLEAWRYSEVDRLLKQPFEINDEPNDFDESAVHAEFLSQPVSARMVFVDGIYQPEHSICDARGIGIRGLRASMALGDSECFKTLASLSGLGEDGFAAMNLATAHDGAVIHITRSQPEDRPIELLHLVTQSGEGRSLRSRNLVVVGPGVSVNLVERYLALDEVECFNNIVSEISLAEGARLNHQRVQMESLKAYHLSDIYLDLNANAHYAGVYASVGAAWSRVSVHNRFSAENAHCDLDGLYLAGDGQLTDFHLDVDHSLPNCSSRENFRGILHGAGKAVFDGSIQVAKGAQKSEAHLHNANLMLSRNAEIDTKPELKILADDVQCSHGTTIGQLDPDAIFYLRSRGLSEIEARNLLSLGFASEVVDRFESETIRVQLEALIKQRLQI
jgi:Fe-S cluster assembly protein SufD